MATKTKTATVTIKLTRDIDTKKVRMRFSVRADRASASFSNDDDVQNEITRLVQEVLDELK